MASASAHLVPEPFSPYNAAEVLQYAILLELRALNTALAAFSPSESPAAPRHDAAPASRATAAPPKGK